MDRRKALKHTAMRLFVEEGFQQTSTARVSREAGVATGTLFTYFNSKDDLINSIYAESKDEQLAFILKKVSDDDSPVKMLKTIWKQGVKWALAHEIQYRFIQLFEASAYGLAYSENHHSVLQKLLTTVYNELKQEGTAVPQELLFKVIVSNQNALIDYLLEHHKGEYDKNVTKQMLELTMSGLMSQA